MEKRGGNSRDLFTWICQNPTRKSIIAVLNKPKLISEIASDVTKKFDLKQKLAISSYIKLLENFNILKRLTPKLKRGKPGNVYGLTRKGIEIASEIYNQINEKFYYKKLRKINWQHYGWCLTGTQKKTVLASLEQKPLRQKEILEIISRSYATRDNKKGMSWQNLTDILAQMIKSGLVIKEETWITKIKKRMKPIRRYGLSYESLRIKEQTLIQ